jgi:6-phosphogluconolactonase
VKGLLSVLVFAAIAAAGAPAFVVEAEQLVYIGTYTTDTNPDSTSKGIYAYRFNEATGMLAPIGLAAETPSPSYLTASKDGRFVFAVNELQTYQGAPSGIASSFAVDKVTGKLTLLSSQPSRGAGPCHLALDRTGRYLAVANYNGGNYALFPVGNDGRLQPSTVVVAGEQTIGDDGVALKGLGHMVLFDATNRFLLASDLGLNKLLVFRFDGGKGTLASNTPPSVTIPQPKSGPRHFDFDPKQQFLFSLAEQAATITPFAWDAKTGLLTLAAGAVPTRPEGVTGGTTAEIFVHPSGKFLYASNRNNPSTIAVFRIAPNGALTLVEHEKTRGATARGFGIDPTGKWLIVCNQEGAGSIGVYAIDQNTGGLSPAGDLAGVSAPVNVIFVK